MLTTDKEIFTFCLGVFISIGMAVKFGSLENSIALGLLGFLGVLIALRKYLYEKARDRKMEIVELVSFFRNQVMTRHEDFLRVARETEGNDYEFPRIPFKEASVNHLKEEFASQSLKQIQLQKKNPEIFYLRHSVINVLEEFALRVHLSEAQDSSKIHCLKQAFIEMVETHAEKLITQRTVFTGGDTFSETIYLYFHWYSSADNLSVEDRLELELAKIV